MAYGNKMKKSPKNPTRNKKSNSSESSKVGQRKAYRMTGKAPGN